MITVNDFKVETEMLNIIRLEIKYAKERKNMHIYNKIKYIEIRLCS